MNPIAFICILAYRDSDGKSKIYSCSTQWHLTLEKRSIKNLKRKSGGLLVAKESSEKRAKTWLTASVCILSPSRFPCRKQKPYLIWKLNFLLKNQICRWDLDWLYLCLDFGRNRLWIPKITCRSCSFESFGISNHRWKDQKRWSKFQAPLSLDGVWSWSRFKEAGFHVPP